MVNSNKQCMMSTKINNAPHANQTGKQLRTKNTNEILRIYYTNLLELCVRC